MNDALDALEAGERSTDDEQHHSNEERVEVPLGPETERVLFRLRALCPGATEQQQDLVAGICDGVNGLRQERCRAGDRERNELGDRNAQVRAERGDYRALTVPAAAVTASTVPRIGRSARSD